MRGVCFDNPVGKLVDVLLREDAVPLPLILFQRPGILVEIVVIARDDLRYQQPAIPSTAAASRNSSAVIRRPPERFT